MTSKYRDIQQIEEEEGLVEVFAAGEYDYSWTEFKGYYQPSSGRYFWYADSGCSCNGFGELLTGLGELSEGTRDSMRDAFREWGKPQISTRSYDTFTQSAYESAMAEIANFRPSKERA